ncbi:MAG TPA: deoxyribose-phosphate aldolase [Syntrophomonadaceae bacterium]|nr:deoxyribose-phosphate aldolase [Syntrophomonadaceae bacterium]HNX29226.1 deoxyribose-phosphate aldolase [Syntrophomonadaceae bacterium]HPR92594.1 deoxyribose-phosphate aldolase [Syntrophomonadaceae bacterium]
MIAAYMDSTNLKADATWDDIIKLCNEAAELKMAAVCINPYRLELAVEVLKDTQVNKCTVIGFPLGADRPAAKYLTARESLLSGADELDMVINVGALKDGGYSYIGNEIKALNQLKDEFEFLLKIIVETALLSEKELVTITKIVSDSQADFIKTSTGFSARGASLNDINLIKRHKSEKLKIKASGGIRTLEAALAFIEAGVHRIGSSNAGVIVEEYRMRGGLLRR